MSGEETARRLREEREAQRIALRENIREAQGAIASAGFAISDQATPLEMVAKLLARNADQKKLEDGLRERLKAAEGLTRRLVFGCFSCPFTATLDQRGDVIACGPLHRKLGFCPDASHPTLALEDCPAIVGILVKKAEEDSGSAPGEAKATEGNPGGGDRSNDPESPR